jgi:hypothetical protein
VGPILHSSPRRRGAIRLTLRRLSLAKSSPVAPGAHELVRREPQPFSQGGHRTAAIDAAAFSAQPQGTGIGPNRLARQPRLPVTKGHWWD